ncbi:cytochrome P450 [Actinomadura hibisca]|uniref:cytochrome P450 n=1 Tax=Actinomadura hibisca TaxID=68565 RepID=UPI00082BD1F7|nr:cytochrome P450 [Actinomadura hibisca]
MEPQTPPADPAPAHPPLADLAVEPLPTAEHDADLAAHYQRLREAHGPVAPVDVLGVPAWLVIGYPQVLEVLRDSRGVWSKRLDSWRARAEGRVPAGWPLLPAFEVDCSVFRDGGESTRLRTAWSAGLQPFQERTRPQARALEAAVRGYADDLITALAEGGPAGTADLAAQYARPLPLMVINRLLGFSTERGEELLVDMWRLLDAGPDAGEAAGRLAAAVAQVCARKREEPGEDLPSTMLAAAPDLTVAELTSEMVMLIGLIGDHTATLICGTAAEMIMGGGGLAGGMIPEAVNRAAIAAPPMANLTFRWPRADVRLGRYTIAAGDPVMLSPAAAHTDPAFTGGRAPDAIYSSRAHLAWGAGPHACLGRDLATTITTIAVERLSERFAELAPAVRPEELEWRSSPLMRGLRSLPVHYRLSAARPLSPSRPEPEAAAEPEQSTSLARRFLRALRLAR